MVQKKHIAMFLGLLLLLLPISVLAQRRPWTQTIQLKDRRDGEQTPVVASVTFEAFYMTDRVSPGQHIMVGENGNTEPVDFGNRPEGFIKFRITNITWDATKTAYDGSSDFKVIVRNLWVNMRPEIYAEKRPGTPNRPLAAMRKLYITAPNVEYIKGDSLPPPTIFKVDRLNTYTFTIGVKAVTPKTVEERPFEYQFTFDVKGLPEGLQKELPPVIQTPPKKKDTIDVVDNTEDINRAIREAIDEERVDDLIELIKENPGNELARKSREKLALRMTKELVDSSTYRIDISYKDFTRVVPSKEQIGLVFSKFGAVLNKANEPFNRWSEGKLFVRPPRDSIDYQVTAIHQDATENKATITLNSIKDYITFSYRDTLESKVSIHVSGGHGPYLLYLQRRSGDDFFNIERSILILGDTVLETERMARLLKLSEEGDYRMYLVDAEHLKKTGVGTIHIVPPPPIPPVVWYSAGGALVAFFIGFLLYRREKRRKDEEMEKLLMARGGLDPKVKRKPKPELQNFWRETAISDLSLHKNFVREIGTYLRERPHINSEKPLVEGVLLGTVLKFDFENEQYEVRLDRFRAIDPKPLDYYDDKGDGEKWADIRQVCEDHRDLVKIGWLQVAEGRPMRLSQLEQQFQDEQFSELFQLLLKIDFVEGEKLCGFFTRTTSGKINDASDRQDGVNYWLNWDQLEDAGYYDTNPRGVRNDDDGGKIKVRMKGQEAI